LQRKYPNLNLVKTPHRIHIEAFRCRCFYLIGQGYNVLNPLSLRDREEPDISGCLVASIEAFIQAPDAPEWVIHYSIKDDPPVNTQKKYGKSRPRADIAFEWVRRGKRPLFRLEAKWVGAKKTSLGAKKGYLGDEGIGCFLSGYYPVDIGYAGMLAYVHSEDEATWAVKIQEKLSEKAEQLRIQKFNGQPWKRDESQEQFHAFISIHSCPLPIGQLHITHLLLRFC
jgi:hypothetical protein